MFRRWRGFVCSYTWYIPVNGGDTFQMIILDLINSLFKCWFRFKSYYFNSAVHTKLLKMFVKQNDCWYIYGSLGDNFQMIIFDLLNSLLKFWLRFEFCNFNSSVHNKLFKIIVKWSDSWYIHICGVNTFQMIIFDLINSIF